MVRTRVVLSVVVLAGGAILVGALLFGQKPVELHGVGASFPAPLYQKWLEDYCKAHRRTRITYDSAGSGAGKKAILAGTADFGASDAAMTEEEMGQVKQGVLLLPMTSGSVVLAYNLHGAPALKLSREAYSGIFLGQVVRWNDPLIARNNPGVVLPNRPIQVVVRGDSSGTTFAFTTHLSAISKEFATRPGVSLKPAWAVGSPQDGTKGVIAHIQRTPGALGYVEHGQAEAAHLSIADLENRHGRFIRPSIASAQSALSSVELFEDLIGWIPDPTPADAYPIVTFTWIICYKEYADGKKAEALKMFLQECLGPGQEQGEPLGFVPLPEKVRRRAKTVVRQIHGR
jgi:phosphate transport system substrate-binding protein